MAVTGDASPRTDERRCGVRAPVPSSVRKYPPSGQALAPASRPHAVQQRLELLRNCLEHRQVTRSTRLAGLILLVAMIGAILLTLRHRRDIKRQDVLQQMWRDPAKAMELKDVKPGQGL